MHQSRTLQENQRLLETSEHERDRNKPMRWSSENNLSTVDGKTEQRESTPRKRHISASVENLVRNMSLDHELEGDKDLKNIGPLDMSQYSHYGKSENVSELKQQIAQLRSKLAESNRHVGLLQLHHKDDLNSSGEVSLMSRSAPPGWIAEQVSKFNNYATELDDSQREYLGLGENATYSDVVEALQGEISQLKERLRDTQQQLVDALDDRKSLQSRLSPSKRQLHQLLEVGNLDFKFTIFYTA